MFSLLCREIERHKWFLSEKRGTDVGWEYAQRDWLERHFPAWKRHHWNEAITELVRTGMPDVREALMPRTVNMRNPRSVLTTVGANEKLWSTN